MGVCRDELWEISHSRETFRQQFRFMRACADIPHWVGKPSFREETQRKGTNMRKLALMAVLASTALATPALARDNAWYVVVEGGAMIVEDIDVDITAPVPVNNAVTIDHKYGFDVDGIIGYDFGAFRVEGEVGYKQAHLDIDDSGGIDGKTQALSFMANALLDFGPDDGMQGFIGGGAGIARVKASGYRDVTVTPSGAGVAVASSR